MKRQNNVRVAPQNNKFSKGLPEYVGEDASVCPQKRNTQTGITLIALVITIIILLILAMVSIKLVMNSGIITRAEKGTEVYSEEEIKEKIKIAYGDYQTSKIDDGNYTFEQALKDGGVNPKSVEGSDEEGYVVTVETRSGDKRYSVSASGVAIAKTLEDYGVKIGDYVAYDEGKGTTYTTATNKGVGGSVGTKDANTGKYQLNSKTYNLEDLNWRVLGVNAKGELELISDNPMSDANKIYLANEEGYLYGPDELNRMCNELYGKGTHAAGARSLNVEDINKLANYDPKTYSGYGVKWTYRYPTTQEKTEPRNMQYSNNGGSTWKDITSASYQKFRMPGETETIGKISEDNIKEGSKTLEYTYYYYTLSDKIKDEKIVNMISNGTGSSTALQWLASRCVNCFSNNAYFCVRYVFSSVDYASLSYSYGNSGSDSNRVRPVVSLKSDVQIDKNGKDGQTAAKAYEIK